MAQRKPYNSNTAYGRKKLREQAHQYRDNLPPQERQQFDNQATLIYIVIIIVVLGLLYLIGGQHAVTKYLQK